MVIPSAMLLRSASFVFALSLPVFADGAGDAFFEKKVRPLLLEHCLECHTAGKKTKGGLALDSRAGWQVGGDGGAAIVPGNVEESLLIKAVRYTDTNLQMPEKRKLPDAAIAVLEEWVKMGAPDPREGQAMAKKKSGMSLDDGRKFWSYVAPRKPAVPEVKDAAWPRNSIDRFVLSKLEAAGLRPSPDAAPDVLARRLSLNVTGLPPSGMSLDAMLASPQFGEHWGRHWLDVARFAESSGGGRTLLYKDAWRYRDYVIEAFNANVPFDRFLREQIAGDLLNPANPDERRRLLTATAFLALGPTNYEEQDKQQLRFDVIDEQLDTIGKTVIGQTVGCARCHDHKFDPIPQRDYYALAGIFASTRTLYNYTDNVARWVDAPLPLPPEREAALKAHEAASAALEKQIAEAKKGATKSGNIMASEVPGIVVDDEDAKLVGPWEHSTRIDGYIGKGYRTDSNGAKGECTVTFTPKFPQAGRYEVRLAYIPGAGRASNVPVTILHADGESDIIVDESVPPPVDGRFVSLGTFRFEKDGAGFVLVSNAGTKGYVVADAVQFIPEGEPVAASPKGNALKELTGKLKQLKESGPKRPLAMAVKEVAGDIGGTHIRVRGLVGQRGELVERGFLNVLGLPAATFSQKESGRRELADWLASRENPLTARVFVNRAWHWLFGVGLVSTVDNFGTTGELPSHPELLDWLAVEFMEHGWDVKWLVRQIVSSRTWQQRSGTGEDRLLSNYPRRRLSAEQLRDAMLVASGELDAALLGPNIAEAGEIDANDTSAQNIEYRYEFKDMRRSVYTPAFRNRRLDLFEVFDFGNINAPLGARSTSTVAPQALFFLNHPWVIARARAAAVRLLQREAPAEVILDAAFASTLGRAPRDGERGKLLVFIAATSDRPTAWEHVFQTLFASVDFRFSD